MRGLTAALLPGAGPAAPPPGAPPPPGGCRRLAALRLRDCGVVDDGRAFDAFAAGLAPSLRSLDLSCTRAGSRALLQLAPLTGLTELLLDMCPVADAGCQVWVGGGGGGGAKEAGVGVHVETVHRGERPWERSCRRAWTLTVWCGRTAGACAGDPRACTLWLS
jgi:hypothetical protein